MKTCPVCDALTFEDAEVCYGCLYRYGKNEPAVKGAHCKPIDDAPPWYEDYDPRDLEMYGFDDPFFDFGEYAGDYDWRDSYYDRDYSEYELLEDTPGVQSFKINMIPEAAKKGGVKWRCNIEMVAP